MSLSARAFRAPSARLRAGLGLAGLGLCALAAAPAHAQLLISNQNTNLINSFAPTGPGTFASNGMIVTPSLVNPAGLAFDAMGDLFAADSGTNTITEFLKGGGTTTLSGGGLNGPKGLAFDSKGDLFAADNNSNMLTEFMATGSGLGPGAVVMTGVPGVNSPMHLAIDAAGDLFTADFNGGTVDEFAATGTPGVFAGAKVVESGLINPTGLAFDSLGDLFVGNSGINTISEFMATGTPGTFGASSTLSGGGLNGVAGLAFDKQGDLFVADRNGPNGGTITEFASAGAGTFGTGKLIPLNGLGGPAFLVVGPASAPVPEASTTVSLGLLLALGLGGMVVAAKRKKAAKAA